MAVLPVVKLDPIEVISRHRVQRSIQVCALGGKVRQESIAGKLSSEEGYTSPE